MRTFVLIITCVVVVGVVIFAVFHAPVSQPPQIAVNRISEELQSLPVIESDPAADNILNFFPDPTSIVVPEETLAPEPVEESPETAADPAIQQSVPRKTTMEGDRGRLLALIEDWVYVEFSQIGNSRKTGTIHKTRDNVYQTVFEGEKLDNGIEVMQLTSDQATLRLGEASFALRIAIVPDFFAEVKNQIRPLTPEEQEAAFDYYMRRYGDKFKAYSKGYKPPYGTRQPTTVTPEEFQKGQEEYMRRYGNQFLKEQQMNQAQGVSPNTEQAQESFRKYWERYHPDKPMPDYNQIFGNRAQTGPGSRIQPNSNSQ